MDGSKEIEERFVSLILLRMGVVLRSRFSSVRDWAEIGCFFFFLHILSYKHIYTFFITFDSN